jgi:3-hydroxyacyl-CoA dehydrogenase/enoyl-CoA hydratase/3-hydroxybutyryl-CoA epimerase
MTTSSNGTDFRSSCGSLTIGRETIDESKAIAHLNMRMEGSVNKVNAQFGKALAEALDWIEDQKDLVGVILRSGHETFCAGGDIEMMAAERDSNRLYELVMQLNRQYTRLEKLQVPVVAAICGSALGGGCELALACHYRVALDHPKTRIGLPEVTLGLIPGSGGTQRLPRLLGLQAAMELITQGRMLVAQKAQAAGLVDAVAEDDEQVLAKARELIASASAKPAWERDGHQTPGPKPGSGEARDLYLAACGLLFDKTAGALEAPQVAVQAIHEGSQLELSRALEVEARHFAKLAVSDQAKAMMGSLWFHKSAAERLDDLPKAATADIERVAILGAGMMGAALGYVCAEQGMQVVLKDIKKGAIDSALAHVAKLAAKRKKGREDQAKAIVERVSGTIELSDLADVDLVIEAVFEDLKLKHRVLEETQGALSQRGIWASNTSALPISELAEPAERPERFIGLHFFSPVEKMPLVEVIVADKTDEQTLARSLAFCRQLKKTPIVVNDGYGFYTTRVFTAYILEGAQMVAEGQDPRLVEWAARAAGMAVGPLQVFDEVTLTLVRHAFENGSRYLEEHRELAKLPGFELVCKLVDQLS